MIKGAYATLLTNESYLAGALVVHRNLRDVKSKYPFLVMYTSTLPLTSVAVLEKQGILLQKIELHEPPEEIRELCKFESRFHDTWTKLRAFELYNYDRIVLMDSDMVVRKNMDELFDLTLPEDYIAASHVCACNPKKFAHYPKDWIPENCAFSAVPNPTAPPMTIEDIATSDKRPYELLNSGLVVLVPSAKTSRGLTHFLAKSPDVPDFRFPDQDLLAAYFKGRWRPLNWYYNALKPLRSIHKPLWNDDEVRCMHYILPSKPWDKKDQQGEFEELHYWWWQSFALVEKDLESSDLDDLKFVRSKIPALN